LAREFVQSKVDMCLYYWGTVAMLIYTDDGILIGPTASNIDDVIQIMQTPAGKENGYRAFNTTDKGNLCNYLGVKVEHLANRLIELSQPHLIQQVLDDVGFNERTTSKPTPAASTVKVNRDLHGQSYYEETWSYQSISEKLHFIEKLTQPDLAYAVVQAHQCAQFSNDPKASHASAVKRTGKYLIHPKTKESSSI
jgi:hypothetical protein